MPNENGVPTSDEADRHLNMIDALASNSPKHLYAALIVNTSGDARVIARELGKLLGIQSFASNKADAVGWYTAADVAQENE